MSNQQDNKAPYYATLIPSLIHDAAAMLSPRTNRDFFVTSACLLLGCALEGFLNVMGARLVGDEEEWTSLEEIAFRPKLRIVLLLAGLKLGELPEWPLLKELKKARDDFAHMKLVGLDNLERPLQERHDVSHLTPKRVREQLDALLRFIDRLAAKDPEEGKASVIAADCRKAAAVGEGDPTELAPEVEDE